MRELAISRGAQTAPVIVRLPDTGRPLGMDGSNEAFDQAKLIRRILRARAERSNYLSACLFSEPAWDMLLELYVAHLLQRRLSVTELCVASRAPQTTALRWIDALKSEGLVDRRKDPFDGRRFFIGLTPKGSDAMRLYVDSVSSRVWPIESALISAAHFSRAPTAIAL